MCPFVFGYDIYIYIYVYIYIYIWRETKQKGLLFRLRLLFLGFAGNQKNKNTKQTQNPCLFLRLRLFGMLCEGTKIHAWETSNDACQILRAPPRASMRRRPPGSAAPGLVGGPSTARKMGGNGPLRRRLPELPRADCQERVVRSTPLRENEEPTPLEPLALNPG